MNSEPYPVPDAEALAVSEALLQRIHSAIGAADGWLSFERFMQMALYEPGLGYYSAGATKFGADGDFTTAPELSHWLADALAAHIETIFSETESRHVLELGAGTGRLAGRLLEQLAARGHADVEYAIFETSADLKSRQAAYLASSESNVRWLETLPEPGFNGIVLANEVADAIPVQRFVKSNGEALPLGVELAGESLAIAPGPIDPALSFAVAGIEAFLGQPLPNGYRSEVCLLLAPWLGDLLGRIEQGGMLLIDYGMTRRDYYRPERTDGTLICHHRQRAHSDPLLWPGLQDISSWVDFSAVATAAEACGFRVEGYTTQAQFLLESIARDPLLSGRQPSPREASAMQSLILPGEMGERFKLMWLANLSFAAKLPGRDFRNWL